MAQKTVVRLTDDVDGSDATETVRFGMDGVGYEIDLSEANAAALREALARYVEHARRAKAAASARRPSTRRARDYDARAVRAWAASHGIELPARGRIPGAVLDQFHAAGN
jgi:hypothetical protein